MPAARWYKIVTVAGLGVPMSQAGVLSWTGRARRAYERTMPQARGRVLTVVRTAFNRRATSSDWYEGKKTLQGVRENVYELRYTHSCRVLLQPVRDELVIVDIGNHDVTTRYAALRPSQRAKLIEDRTPAPPGFTGTHPLFEEVDEGTYTSNDPVTGWAEFLSDDQAALADLILEQTQYADLADETEVIYLRGGAGTGKTAVLLNLALRLHDAGIPVDFRCSTAVAKYLAAHTRVNVKRLQAPMAPHAAILLDDPRSPASVTAAVNQARLAKAPAVIVGFDPLQWPLKSLDTHLQAMPKPDIDEALHDCYRQSAALARQATEVVTRIHERSSFRVDPVRIEAERRVLAELSNHYLTGLQFTRPGGRFAIRGCAEDDVYAEAGRLKSRADLWQDLPALLVLEDRAHGVTLVPDFKKYRRGINTQTSALEDVAAYRGLDFQTVWIFMHRTFYERIQQGVTGLKGAEWASLLNMHIPMTRARDDTILFLVD
ncbi:hypothetical protein [Micromonospora sp. NPDC023814]|uniref:hypothetical protein n=1 Tax=Micromonospora sp. NPDC023814 TaxID=3154596 RepID=UPI0033FF2765